MFDATPVANAVLTASRSAGTSIVDQYLDDRRLTGLKVLMGGGRKWFLPNAANSSKPQPVNGRQRRSTSDYVLSADLQAGWGAAAGAIDADRDLLADAQAADFSHASDNASWQAASTPAKLLGLFAYSNMNVAFDTVNGRRVTSSTVADYGFPDQPMLDAMTSTAVKVLKHSKRNGFVLMVDGASIDEQSHLADAALRAKAPGSADMGDAWSASMKRRECRPLRGLSLEPEPEPEPEADARRAAAVRGPGPAELLLGQPECAQRIHRLPGGGPGAWRPGGAQHTATDVPLSAVGRSASLFAGVFDNTNVFCTLGQAALGRAR